MGKLKPSPEAIDLFMSSGDKVIKRAKLAMMDILIERLVVIILQYFYIENSARRIA